AGRLSCAATGRTHPARAAVMAISFFIGLLLGAPVPFPDQPRVTVSSRLSTTLAIIIHAASSATSSLASRFDSPTPRSFSAAARSEALPPPPRSLPIRRQLPLEQPLEHRRLALGRTPRRRQPEGQRDALLGRFRLVEQSPRQLARRLHERRVVHQR